MPAGTTDVIRTDGAGDRQNGLMDIRTQPGAARLFVLEQACG